MTQQYCVDWDIILMAIYMGRFRGLTCSALDHIALLPEFESRRWHIWRALHLWLRFITYGCRSAHLAYLVHKNGRKTSITIIVSSITTSHHNTTSSNYLDPTKWPSPCLTIWLSYQVQSIRLRLTTNSHFIFEIIYNLDLYSQRPGTHTLYVITFYNPIRRQPSKHRLESIRGKTYGKETETRKNQRLKS